ncbi:MAG: acyl-CoA dehydrogenase family protein [Burkholderiaceae bacterium]
MHFEFSSDQLRLKDEVRKVLAGRSAPAQVRQVLEQGLPLDRGLWSTLGELGFLGAAIPEAHGGTGAGYLELCVLAEEFGRALAPIPFSSSVCLGAELILAAGSPAQKARWLPALASGQSIACLAVAEGPGRLGPQAVSARVAGGTLCGSKWPVLDGGCADVAIVAARADACLGLFIVELAGAGVTRMPLESLDPTRGQVRIDFQDAQAELLTADGWPVLEAALDRAAVLAAFEQIGGAGRALEMARDYALERHAFGRPIGSFQAIKHKLADMYVSLVLARSNAYYGAWALAHGAPELPEAAAAARVSATQAYRQCTAENIQIHGGMGFTWEMDCHLYYRRAHLLAVSLGGLTQWQDRLIEQLHARRAAPETSAHGL